MIRILLADNQPLTQKGCIALFSASPNLEIIGLPATRQALEDQLGAAKPQVVIIDHHVNDEFDCDFIVDLAGRCKPSKLLVLSESRLREEIATLSEQGINYISKRCTDDEIIKAVEATAAGEPFFCESTQQLLQINLPLLSSREAEIVQLIADGLTNKEIADRLYISIHTVKTHRKNMIKKLGFTFKNTAELSSLIKSL